MALKEIKTKYQHYFEDESGKKQGEYKWWNDNGKLRGHCFYVDGNIHSEFKRWHLNGQLCVHCFFVDDKRHGEFKRWYPNGQLSRHCFYVDGKPHGEYKAWYSDGQQLEHCFYVDDKVVIDFLKDPDLCPVTDEAKTYFALKYGSGKWLP
jgi:antitoxin component YwqK of YwqJK toxin-antitoxin module